MERVRLTDIKDSAFAEAWELYEKSFPIYEQRRIAQQEAVMSQPDYHFEVLYQGGRFAGIMLYWRQDKFVYLEHFAIVPSLRGGGLGTKALGLLLEDGVTVILEIDPVQDEISRKRLGFYQGLGFVCSPFKHIHPPYRQQFTGHRLEVMSSGRELSVEEYNDFAFYLNNRVMEYSE